MLHMKEDETIDAFTIKLTTLVNKAASLGHTMEDETLVRKLLNVVPDRLKTYEERIKYKGKQVDNQDNYCSHDMKNKAENVVMEWKEIPFNLDLTDIKQQGVVSESLDGGVTKSMNQPGIKEDIHCKNSKLEGGNNQKYDQPGLKEDHNNKCENNWKK
nr:hypothetical protein [Tanacetum cinerariifolium]